MIEVVIPHHRAPAIIDIVEQLRERGWVQGRDFDFKYEPSGIFNYLELEPGPPQTRFIFYQEELATLFALTYL
jgi:hypothetical protein